MSAGRCAGCGFTDASCKKVDKHVSDCPDYIKLFKEDPTKALPPAKEFERWKAEEADDDKAEAKTERITKNRAEADRRLDKQASRWAAQEPNQLTEALDEEAAPEVTADFVAENADDFADEASAAADLKPAEIFTDTTESAGSPERPFA